MADGVDAGTFVTKLLEMARLDPEYLKDLDKLRRPVVVVFTDIQGSTAYFEEHGDAAGLLMVHNCNRTVREAVEKRGGQIIKSIGDGMLATFTDAAAAVNASINMQTILSEVNDLRPDAQRVGVRIGIHYGIGIVKANDVFGDVVNMASRVESAAAAGQIVISDALRKQLDESQFNIRELGRFKLKGKTSEHSLFEVVWNPKAAAPAKPAAQVARFLVQEMNPDGSLGAEHPILPQLTIGRTQGDLRFATDASMAPLNARLFVQDGRLVVEDLSDGFEKIFIRVMGSCTLQSGDVIIMGQQIFRFREVPGAMSAVTQLGISLKDIRNALEKAAAELVRTTDGGQANDVYPLNTAKTELGRTRGDYTFPNDTMMSRLHARILQRGEDFLLEDATSRNGTFINLRGKTNIADGSAVLVGSHLFRVKAVV